ncbi:MAG: hypothetical protein R3D26_08795 [Cyanobacteriota/Melainabacteria group bacterium]
MMMPSRVVSLISLIMPISLKELWLFSIRWRMAMFLCKSPIGSVRLLLEPESRLKAMQRRILLKLKSSNCALALADRLDTGSQLRRKAHRDMVLWYQELGKSYAARNEKEILFNLVGVHDDKIFYPQSSGCGNIIWWKAETIRAKMACGMG